MTMNVEHARHAMIEQQVRPWDIVDLQVLAAMSAMVKRLPQTKSPLISASSHWSFLAAIAFSSAPAACETIGKRGSNIGRPCVARKPLAIGSQ